jgi:hemerythrin
VEYELSWIARHLEEEDAELGHWLRKSETALNCAVESLSSSIPKTADACTEI